MVFIVIFWVYIVFYCLGYLYFRRVLCGVKGYFGDNLREIKMWSGFWGV